MACLRGIRIGITKVPTADEHFLALKLERLNLKDKLYQYLVQDAI